MENNAKQIFVGKGQKEVYLLPEMSNRHGLIAGATGTGKTVTLKVLAEDFSRLGVPVFLADVKGDLAGLAQPGSLNPKIQERAEKLGLKDLPFSGFPVAFWDVFGELGHPVRTTISEMGPLLLSRLLDLNDTQSGVLTVVFRIADDQGLLLLDLKDLQALLKYVAESAKEFSTQYGNISSTSIATIQRNVLMLEEQGAETFFGEPALKLSDIMRVDPSGYGVINIFSAEKLLQTPRIYSTFLLWLLSELFESLPEAGDLPKPKLVFFFDEAHLLFNEAPKVLLEKIEQVVRLIRSKGVGIFFVTQSALDIPDNVLGQLGNRVQHALRAFTPKDKKALKLTAETFRSDDSFDVEGALTELGVGEALVSTLDSQGSVGVVERCLIAPPLSKFGSISPEERGQIVRHSILFPNYAEHIDRDSAFEMLERRTDHAAEALDRIQVERPARAAAKAPRESGSGGRQRQSTMEAFAKSTARSVGSSLGRQIVRGILGSILGSRR